MRQAEDLCETCIFFDMYNHECEKNHYLDSSKVTIECEDYSVEDVEDETM